MQLCRRSNTALLTAILTLALISVLSAAARADRIIPALTDQPVVCEKADPAAFDNVKRTLVNRDGDTLMVWIYFTDKGITGKSGFSGRATSVTISERALARRAKVGLDHVVFADLPVPEGYLEQVIERGAIHRRTSRWLNAASFEIPVDRYDEICRLPFVAKVRPLGLYRRRPFESTPIRIDRLDPLSLSPEVLDYGASEGQLAQINVPAMHNKGLDGTGVTLAIFDTGFRKTHEAFAQHYADGRVLAEWDFIFNDGNVANEVGDWPSQWSHGTLIWSVSGGHKDGNIYGPAYKANFILCKTEDVRSETPVEEDNWVAALEWVDSIGADVVTSSLSYLEWDPGTGTDYTFQDLDGATATTSIAASMAADLGIVVCNAASNSGPDPSTIGAPADAFDILTCGAVYQSGALASFSSRGPTYDGRIKPEVCAQGVSTVCATSGSDYSYGTANGTSLSTPLVAGAACLMIQARPGFTAQAIRQALMETADNANSPDNNYGWGVMDGDAALGWGADFEADITLGHAPAVVQFTGISPLTVDTWTWSLGDGGSAYVQDPAHTYTETGIFDVSLTAGTSMGDITLEKEAYIIVLGDTVRFVSDSALPGRDVMMSVSLVNSQPLSRFVIPFQYEDVPPLSLDSVTRGDRTAYFEQLQEVASDPGSNRYAWELTADDGGGQPPLPKGSGEVMRLYFTIAPLTPGGLSNKVDSALGSETLELTSALLTYEPVIHPGFIVVSLVRGDMDNSGFIDIADLVYLVDHMFNEGPPPTPPEAGDVDAQGGPIDIADLVYMVDFMFNQGLPPVGQ
ncbi:MAG: S8 family serine peptidase [candidate division Zixibacteria bacterium]|nr:S8 family serine peptidase [candidate division Zixibacteria bacterium]